MPRRRDSGEPPANDNEPVVDSSTLRRVAYQRERGTLRLTFTTGKVYEYFEVPPRIHAGLMQADSKGRYFNRHIRPRFAYRRVR